MEKQKQEWDVFHFCLSINEMSQALGSTPWEAWSPLFGLRTLSRENLLPDQHLGMPT